MQMPSWVSTLRQQVDSWAQQQRTALPAVNLPGWPPWHWKLKLPWHEDKRRKEELEEEYRRTKMQIEGLCEAVKVDDLAGLQDVLGAMILAECAYKRPATEVLRALNSFKADFGGQIISVHRLQASLEHVHHRYILAEGGDTLFAAFAGTKHYRDVITDANFLQGELFNDDEHESDINEEGLDKPGGLPTELSTLPKTKPKLIRLKPAAHRGFLSRAKGIPAVEIYKLAQRKDRKLVLCGHSLGGAVAVLATLAILRVFATPSVAKAGGKLQIKCITFSQPPVGNAALRDYVHQNGWQQHFQTYCIPEDLIPRILSPAYFQHFRTQVSNLETRLQVKPPAPFELSKDKESGPDRGIPGDQIPRKAGSDRMVLGVGPLPKYPWRLPKLWPIVGTPQLFPWFKGRNGDGLTEASQDLKPESRAKVPPLEIHENTRAITRTNLPPLQVNPSSLDETGVPPQGAESGSLGDSGNNVTSDLDVSRKGKGGNGTDWLKRVPSVPVPSLPSYFPFGQLYLLKKASIEPLSASEYTQLTSVQSVLQELKELFRSHTMKSYRSRFLRIYDSFMSASLASSLRMEHVPHLPHLQHWLGVVGASIAEMGMISEPILVRSATALVPLGWTGLPGTKGAKPLIVDVQGLGLHLCTLVRARVNGQWCSTTLESLPPAASPPEELQQLQPKLQNMRVRIGPSNSNNKEGKDALDASQDVSKSVPVAKSLKSKDGLQTGVSQDRRIYEVEGLGEVTVQCSTDFTTASQDVVARLRRVRLLGLEGAGKTSLYFALLGEGGRTLAGSDGGVLPGMDWREGVADGVSYVDGAGINLQDLVNETERLRQEVRLNVGQRRKTLDLIILVHNLAHKIPRLHSSVSVPQQPALSGLLHEIAQAGIPVILAITNKFAVSADRRHLAASTIMNTYKIPSNLTVVVNSCPYNVNGLSSESIDSLDPPALEGSEKGQQGASHVQWLLHGPMRLVSHPFGKREVVLPPDGIKKLTTLIHIVLSDHEEAACKNFAKEQLALQNAEELVQAPRSSASLGRGNSGPVTAAAIGAACGAGFGVFVAVVLGATSALRKP